MDKKNIPYYNLYMPGKDMKKIVVITGASSGIGLETARVLIRENMHVVGLGRSSEKCDQARDYITHKCPQKKEALHFIIADLSSQREVKHAAGLIRDHLKALGRPQLDVLINNAGTVASHRIETIDGFELQWAVNYLAPFLLTHQLFSLLNQGHDARILTVSSESHRGARIHWKDPNFHTGYNPLRSYKQSKLANVLFTKHFNQVFESITQIKAFAVDPGLVRTEIGHKNTSGIAYWIWSIRQKSAVSAAEGAATSVYLSTAPRESISGKAYWKHCRPAKSSAYSDNTEAAEHLWKISEEMCGISFDHHPASIGNNSALL